MAAAHLLARRRVRRARHVAVYLSVGSELPTAPLIEALRRRAGVVVWAPVVGRTGTMRFARLGRGPLNRDRCGMPAPARLRTRRSARRMDLIVMPLLGFDGAGQRLGSGRGYYDRALAGRRGRRPWLVGYAYAAQELPSLPADPWDVRLDAVATESGYRRLRGR